MNAQHRAARPDADRRQGHPAVRARQHGAARRRGGQCPHPEPRPSIIDMYGPRGDLNMGPEQLRAAGHRFRRREVRHPGRQRQRTARPTPSSWTSKARTKPRKLPHGEERAHEAGSAAGQVGLAAASRWKLPPTSSISSWKVATCSRPATPSAKRRSRFCRRRRDRSRRRAAKPGTGHGQRQLHDGRDRGQVPRDLRRQQSHPDAAWLAELPHRVDLAWPARQGQHRATSWTSLSLPMAACEKLIQTGNFEYHEPPAESDTGGRAAFADVATYTPSDSDAGADRFAARDRRRHDHHGDARAHESPDRRRLRRRQRQDHLQRSEAAAQRSVAGELGPDPRHGAAHDRAPSSRASRITPATCGCGRRPTWCVLRRSTSTTQKRIHRRRVGQAARRCRACSCSSRRMAS